MTKKQKKMLWRIIATAVIILVIKLFSIGGIAGTLLYLPWKRALRGWM